MLPGVRSRLPPMRRRATPPARALGRSRQRWNSEARSYAFSTWAATVTAASVPSARRTPSLAAPG
eukprot:5018935-Alexandrium_andersonii.AAC.1